VLKDKKIAILVRPQFHNQETTIPKARERGEFLADEELEHKRLLSEDLASTHGGQGHFQ
jgi:hypothetical protein